MHEGIPREPDRLQMCKSPLHVLRTIYPHTALGSSWQLCTFTVKLLIKSKVLFLQCYRFGEARRQPCMLFWDTHYHTPVPDVTGKVQGILEKRNCNYLREADENLKRVNVIRDPVCSSLHIHTDLLNTPDKGLHAIFSTYDFILLFCCRMSSRYCSVILRSVEWFLTSHLFFGSIHVQNNDFMLTV